MKIHLFPLLCALLLLSACARQPMSGVPAAPSEADAVWKRYTAYCAAQDTARPYRLQASLRYGTEGDTRRVLLLLWGNGTFPMRLDVMAGVGATVARIAEDSEQFLLYAPNEQKAYFHRGAAKPLLKVDVPIPLGVADLAELLNGRFGLLFGEHYAGQGLVLPNGNLAFAPVGGQLQGVLELDPHGLPQHWKQGDGGNGWDIRIAYDENALPRRLDITRGNGKRAVLLVKERQFPATPFTEAQLRLLLPEGTPVLPLRQQGKQ